MGARVRFETCSDGVPRDVLTRGEVMMRIVAELMITANAAVAEDRRGDPRAFVRSHPPPRPEGSRNWRVVKRYGGTLDATDGTALAIALVAISKATSSDKV